MSLVCQGCKMQKIIFQGCKMQKIMSLVCQGCKMQKIMSLVGYSCPIFCKMLVRLARDLLLMCQSWPSLGRDSIVHWKHGQLDVPKCFYGVIHVLRLNRLD